jgi:hypothetical protein
LHLQSSAHAGHTSAQRRSLASYTTPGDGNEG